MKVYAILALVCLGLVVCPSGAAPGSRDINSNDAFPSGAYNERILALRAKVKDVTRKTVNIRDFFERILSQGSNQAPIGGPAQEASNEFGDYVIAQVEDLGNSVGTLQDESANIQAFLQQNREKNANSGNPILLVLSDIEKMSEFAQFAEGIAGLKSDVIGLRDEFYRLRDAYERYQIFQGQAPYVSDGQGYLASFGTEAADVYFTSAINDLKVEVDFLRITGMRFLNFVQSQTA